jgi:YidC/Oxa1 family membrane protein insertase
LLSVYPVLILYMSYNFPSALPLYWFYSNIYTIIQNYFLYRNNDKEAALANVKTASQTGSSNSKKKSNKNSKGAKKSR